MRVTAISGTGSKSPACFLVETDRARFILDLGEGPQPGLFPDLSGVGTVDAVLISHGHNDHVGGLHLLNQIGSPPVYATAMTRAFSGHPALAEAHDLPLNGTIKVAGVTVETGRAGHAAGAVWMRIGGENGVLYTGDLCRESLLYPVDTPPRADTLIADASYDTYDDPIDPAIAELIARAGRGPILLPLPPTGRGVEIAVLLHEAGLPVSICATHRRTAELMLAAAPDTLAADGPQRLQTMLANAANLDQNSEPTGVMIAANGAATGGLSQKLLTRFLPDTSIAITMTGHVEPGTEAGDAIANGRADFLRWNVHPRLRDLLSLNDMVRPSRTILAFGKAAEMTAVTERLSRP